MSPGAGTVRPPLTYATRRSALALAQCRALVARLRGTDTALEMRELTVVTSGDRIQDRPLADIGGKGLFVKEIEEALLDGRADFAVHSMKDVPSVLPPGLVMAAVPAREDPRDVLVSPRFGTLEALPRGARVGTSSLRRRVVLERARPDLVIEPLRGNVDTRLRKVDAGECDAIVLARAGLVRLGLEGRATQTLPPEASLPAPGQGALGVECREEDEALRRILARVHDTDTATCVAAERGVLAAVGGDCRTPLGAYAERHGSNLRVRAFISPDGRVASYRDAERSVPWPAIPDAARDVGLAIGRELLGI
jgi:hydroxymethylbilane synthase